MGRNYIVEFLINIFMVNSLISGIVAILVLLILMWIFINLQKKRNWNKYTPLRIVVLIITIVVFSATFAFYNWGVNKGINKSEVLNTLQNLNNNKIKSLMFFYESNDYKFSDTIFIENDTIIKKFSKALSGLEKYNSNHPWVPWTINLKINLENRKLDNILLNLKKDKRDGSIYFRIMKETHLGSFNLGLYYNRDLGDLLKKYYFENNKIKD
jgi:hypothetical protein